MNTLKDKQLKIKAISSDETRVLQFYPKRWATIWAAEGGAINTGGPRAKVTFLDKRKK